MTNKTNLIAKLLSGRAVALLLSFRNYHFQLSIMRGVFPNMPNQFDIGLDRLPPDKFVAVIPVRRGALDAAYLDCGDVELGGQAVRCLLVESETLCSAAFLLCVSDYNCEEKLRPGKPTRAGFLNKHANLFNAANCRNIVCVFEPLSRDYYSVRLKELRHDAAFAVGNVHIGYAFLKGYQTTVDSDMDNENSALQTAVAKIASKVQGELLPMLINRRLTAADAARFVSLPGKPDAAIANREYHDAQRFMELLEDNAGICVFDTRLKGERAEKECRQWTKFLERALDDCRNNIVFTSMDPENIRKLKNYVEWGKFGEAKNFLKSTAQRDLKLINDMLNA